MPSNGKIDAKISTAKSLPIYRSGFFRPQMSSLAVEFVHEQAGISIEYRDVILLYDNWLRDKDFHVFIQLDWIFWSFQRRSWKTGLSIPMSSRCMPNIMKPENPYHRNWLIKSHWMPMLLKPFRKRAFLIGKRPTHSERTFWLLAAPRTRWHSI